MSSGERAAFAGQITDLPVSELLQTVVHGKQTGLARFQTNLGSATIWFRDGTLVDADMGRFHMGAAVRRLLTADTGTFEIEFKPISRRRLIKEEAQELLDAAEPAAAPEPKGGPRRARSAPGWRPTGGGKGAARDGVAGEAALASPEPAPLALDTRRRLEQLGRASQHPTDAVLQATAPIGPTEGEDENLTRVARPPSRDADPPDESEASPVGIEAEEVSDPIPIGTTWEAPSYLSAPDPASPARSGEIKRRSNDGQRTMVGFAPALPFEETRPEPEPVAAKPATSKYRTVGESAQSQRASSIAATIGLDPTASGVADPPPVQRTSAAPAVVGRYEVLLRIARGGMGTVYLCRVTGAGGFRRLFALKVIRDHLSRNAEYVTMLLQEARIASRLHHPNVVGIVDIGTLANQHYLVMDYVEGCTFSELLKVHRKSRPPQLVIPIVLDALTGLHAAHTLGTDDGSPLTLVHCDFSPQNILVGTDGVCRITDFGIARASGAFPERSSITRGKPAYLAPEQVLGRPFDHRADVFAAGIVLWNALTGEQLFSGSTPEEILEMVLRRPIEPPSSVGLRPPRCLDAVVMRALQRDPNARYQTAEEMSIDLRRVAIAENLLAPPSGVARWVTDTFGTQLELRRQAAGMVGKPPADDVSVPELGLGASAAATRSLAPGSEAQGDDSRTVMLRTEAAVEVALDRRQRSVVFGIAAAMAGIAIALAFMRPGWVLGGFLDEDGTYFEPAPPVVLPSDVDVAPDETKSAAETKAAGEAKNGEGKPEVAESKTPVTDAEAKGEAAEVPEPPADGPTSQEGAVDIPGQRASHEAAAPVSEAPAKVPASGKTEVPARPSASGAKPRNTPRPKPRAPKPANREPEPASDADAESETDGAPEANAAPPRQPEPEPEPEPVAPPEREPQPEVPPAPDPEPQ